jgi:hypothetical protein
MHFIWENLWLLLIVNVISMAIYATTVANIILIRYDGGMQSRMYALL